ncbi:MAG: elongation factor G [Desulfovibrio sp.]
MSSQLNVPLKKVRNLGVIAHIDAGKTTLSERFLYYSGKIHRMGEVHDGTATMDFMPEEQERGITIASAVTSCAWNGCAFNIIDTPGHVDFTIEVERCLRVLDGVVGVFCGVSGVEPQSETVWRQSNKYNIPKIAFVNKMDRIGANFSDVLESLRTRLRVNPLVLTLPDGEGDEFQGVFDLVTMQKLRFDSEDDGSVVESVALTDEDRAFLDPWEELLIEAASDVDEDILEIYLSGEKVPQDKLKAAIRQLTLSMERVPVFAGSALKNSGIQLVMDGVCDYLPSPMDSSDGEVPLVSGHTPDGDEVVRALKPSEPLSALVYKVVMESGHLSAFVRVYSGELKEGDRIFNTTQGKVERAAHLYRMHANRRESVEAVQAGDMVAVGGLKFARTGDTLCLKDKPILLEQIDTYIPVISIAIEPANSTEAEKLEEALHKYQLEDPTLTFHQDEDTAQFILSGMGELHLEVVLERLQREYKIFPRTGRPQVVYQETVTASSTGAGVFDRELGGTMHFGGVQLRIEPRERGAGNEVVFESDDEVSSQWQEATLEGVEDALLSGVLRGYPVQDVKVIVTGLEVREKESSMPGYRMAAAMAVKEALSAGNSVMLEPIMELEITVPEDFVGDAVSLLGATGAKIDSMTERAELKVITSVAAMNQLFGFSTSLRSSTQGRAGFVMKFNRFDSLV